MLGKGGLGGDGLLGSLGCWGGSREIEFMLSSENQFVSDWHRARMMLVSSGLAGPPPSSRIRRRSSTLSFINRGPMFVVKPKFILATFNSVFLVLLLVLVNPVFSDKIPIGAIFEQGTDEVQSAFTFAMLNHNKNTSKRNFELQAYVDVINTADAFKLSRLICTQFNRGVFSMLGAVSPDSFDTLHSYSNTFQMPFVTPWFPEKVLTPSSGVNDFAISMRPDYHRAIIETVQYYKWKKIVYLYDSHDGNLLIMDSGFHEGWSTPLLPKLKKDKSLSIEDHETGWIINFLYVGVGLGSLIPFLLMDTIGRKGTLLVASVPKICSWILLGFATNVTTIYIGRMLAGVGCGVTYSVAPIYLGEITSKHTRGLLSTMMAVLINIGMLIIYALGLHFSRLTSSMIAISVPIIFLMCFIWLPETAVYLTKKNRLTSAERTLQWALNRKNVDEELDEIKRIVYSESKESNTFLESLMDIYRKSESRRAFKVVMILLSALTLSGAPPILAYQSETFSKAGYAFSVDIIIVISGCTLVLAGCVCVATVKTTGKRLLLLISAPIATTSLATVAVFYTLQVNGFDVSAIRWIPILGVVVYILSYGLALNPIPIAYIGEIFPNEVKVPAAIFCALYYAIASVVVVEFYQIIEKSYGTYLSFWSFSVITLILTYLIYLYVPETEGKSLEEIQTELKGKKAICEEMTDLKECS